MKFLIEKGHEEYKLTLLVLNRKIDTMQKERHFEKPYTMVNNKYLIEI